MEKRKKPVWDSGKMIPLCFYLVVVLLCLWHRDKITIDAIVSYTPKAPMLAALVMFALFALKGCTVFLNGNILYAASGVLFPLPAALAVNAAGTLAMTTIPFLVGRHAGTEGMEVLARKYKKLELVRSAPRENELQFTFLLRILGILPCEVVGIYLGACGLRYGRYLAGTMLGLLPAIAAYAVIGEYAAAPASPQFIVAAVFQVGTMICAFVAALVWKSRRTACQKRAD